MATTAHPLTGSTTQTPSTPARLSSSVTPASSTPATTFSVFQGSTTCNADSVIAGTAGSRGEVLAGCDGTVGSPDAPKIVVAAVNQPVYIQLSFGQGRISLTASPAGSARVNGLTITPLRTGRITVTVTGLYCAYLPATGRQPTSCTMMVIRAAEL